MNEYNGSSRVLDIFHKLEDVLVEWRGYMLKDDHARLKKALCDACANKCRAEAREIDEWLLRKTGLADPPPM